MYFKTRPQVFLPFRHCMLDIVGSFNTQQWGSKRTILVCPPAVQYWLIHLHSIPNLNSDHLKKKLFTSYLHLIRSLILPLLCTFLMMSVCLSVFLSVSDLLSVARSCFCESVCVCMYVSMFHCWCVTVSPLYCSVPSKNKQKKKSLEPEWQAEQTMRTQLKKRRISSSAWNCKWFLN